MLLFGVRSGKLKIHAVDQTYIQEANARNHIQKKQGDSSETETNLEVLICEQIECLADLR